MGLRALTQRLYLHCYGSTRNTEAPRINWSNEAHRLQPGGASATWTTLEGNPNQ
ncbi:hypothetical protein GCM10023094_00580 [Rhodococcus olei]|uniref:Uncharacterized protein n=1 Tax=Rhodococcus olei TaxID=2161675 RepID=A0ABP8NQ42_9NOCA